jgi:hypothetical protein
MTLGRRRRTPDLASIASGGCGPGGDASAPAAVRARRGEVLHVQRRLVAPEQQCLDGATPLDRIACYRAYLRVVTGNACVPDVGRDLDEPRGISPVRRKLARNRHPA